MPYTGNQGAACYAKATTCLRAGKEPSWKCQDAWKTVFTSTERSRVNDAQYGPTTCGGPLREPGIKTTRDIKKYTKVTKVTKVKRQYKDGGAQIPLTTAMYKDGGKQFAKSGKRLPPPIVA